MTKEEQKKLQKIQMEILDEIDKICKNNDIDYFLEAGTLLGAVRHNGFIPWDDDMDIAMTRDNYEKFLKIANKELNSNIYYIQTMDNDLNYPQPFAKVRKNYTLLQEKINIGKDLHQGIFVDIFPIDYVSNLLILAKIKMLYIVSLRTMLLKKLGYPVKGKSKLQSIVIAILTFFSNFFSINYLKRIINKRIRSKKTNTKYMASLAGNSLFNGIHVSNIFQKIITHKFEDKKYFILKDYDIYLTDLYGDYMTPPPKKEREIGHQITNIKFKTKQKKGF